MQPTQTYKVTFSGNTLDGKTTREVAEQFSQAFNLTDKQVLMRLFSGQFITLKRGLVYEQAQRYSNILQKMGADCCIECENPISFTGDKEVDHEYERKKRKRLAHYSSKELDRLEITPKA